MTQTVTVTQASIADLIKQRDELLAFARAFEAWEAQVILEGDWRDECVKLTPDLHDAWQHLAEQRNAAIAKASPIVGLTESGGCDEL